LYLLLAYSQILIGNKHIHIFVLAGCLSCLALLSDAQIHPDYVPIEVDMKQDIPLDFLKKSQGSTPIRIATQPRKKRKKRRKDTRLWEEFKTQTRYSVKEVFLSGNIYYNDTFSHYIRKIAAPIIEKSSAKRSIRIYACRYTSANAYTWLDGTILINIGLLKRIKNEDQLAFVLAHEIAHLEAGHQYQNFEHQEHASRGGVVSSESYLNFIRFNDGHEREADLRAMELLNETKYDATAGATVLNLLDEHSRIKADKRYLSALTGQNLIHENEWCSSAQQAEYQRINSREFGYHGIYERMKALNQKPIPSKTSTEYQQIREMARIEDVSNLYEKASYVPSLYAALEALEDYPDNRFLKETAAKSLFSIARFARNGRITAMLRAQCRDANFALSSLCCTFQTMDAARTQEVAHNFVKNAYESTKDSEELTILYAKSIEQYQGIQAARPIYSLYLSKFASGKHKRLVQKKLQID